MDKKEYIERSALIKDIRGLTTETWGKGLKNGWWSHSVQIKDNFLRLIEKSPAADVAPVVRCKDCKHWRHETDGMIDHYECNIFCGCYGRGYLTNADDFCSYGERKE